MINRIVGEWYITGVKINPVLAISPTMVVEHILEAY